MNTVQRTLHQLRHDFRRHGLLLLLLTVLLFAFGVADIMRHNPGSEQQFGSDILMLIFIGFGLVLIMIAIHGDPAVGSEAFWMTRPLGGLEIFFSKAAFILLIAAMLLAGWVLPPLVTGAESVAAGFFRDYWKLIVPLIAAIAVVAALTRNLTQALLAGGILWVAAFALAWLWNLVAGFPPVMFKNEAMQESGWILGVGLILLASLGAVAHQYLRRSIGTSIAVSAVGMFAAYLVFQYSRIDLVTNRLSAEEQQVLGLDQATISVDTDPQTFQQGHHTYIISSGNLEFMTLAAETRVEELPEGVFATAIAIEGNLSENRGAGKVPDLRLPGTVEEIPSMTGRFSTDRFAKGAIQLEGYELLQAGGIDQPKPPHFANFLMIDRTRYAGLKERRWRYDGIAQCRLASTVKLTSIPFGAVSTSHGEGWRMQVDSQTEGENNLEVNIKISSWRHTHWDDRLRSKVGCVIANPMRREALVSLSGGGGGTSSNRHSYRDWNHRFSRRFRHGEEMIEITDEWLADAEVWIFGQNSLGVIEREISIENLQLP